jgi:ABC-type transporter Mla MlaB component
VRPALDRRERRPAGGAVVVRASVGPGDVESLVAGVRDRLLEDRIVVCDVRAVTVPDIGTLEALARLQLRARQLGGEIALRHASAALVELIDVVGLREVLLSEG